MSFVRRKIEVVFTLGPRLDNSGNTVAQPTFSGSTNSDTLTLNGYRTSAKISKAGGAGMSQLQLRIYGMKLSQMNDLSTLGMLPGVVTNNSVTISAGDEGSSLSTVFQGTISNAWIDFQGVPDVAFHVLAHVGLFQAVQRISPSSYNGSVDVATIMKNLASQMNLGFENSGVSGIMLSYPYLPGSARSQAQACAYAANIEWIIDDGKLIIWKRGEGRDLQVPEISPDTGLVGYPVFNPQGISFRNLYNPAIKFGGKIHVTSGLKPASGTWRVYNLDYDLESEAPDGAWFETVLAGPLDQTPVVK